MTVHNNVAENKNTVGDWILRLVKGVLVGIGAIVPGLSGGVFMVIFGIYEPLMRFLGNLQEKFLKNVLYFIPVGLGLAVGIIGFSAVVDYAFSNFAAQFIWLFIGFIAGTFPSLFKTAGKKGRKMGHWMVLVAAAVGIFLFMRWIASVQNVTLEPTFTNWLLSGALIGLGLVVPGLSPSNFLIYLGLYQAMANGIKTLDFGIILPLALGVILCVLVFAKLVAWLFKKAYSSMYHLILGVVVGSTLAIIPGGVSGWTILVCAVLFVLGGIASFMLARFDEQHPHDSLI